MSNRIAILLGAASWAAICATCAFTAPEAIGATLAIGVLARVFQRLEEWS